MPARRIRSAATSQQAPEDIFRAIADYTYDWESWIDLDGITRWVNPAVKRISGYTIAECLAMTDYPLPIVHEEDRTKVKQALLAASQGGSGNDLEFRVVHKSGNTRWGAISWQSVFDSAGVRRGYRTSVRDISARKHGEEELRQAKITAEQANRAKGEFLANMSHEIRSPIQCISGYAQLLAKTKLNAKQARYVTILGQQNDALLKVVDDILDFSSLQAVTPKLESIPFSVADFVDQIRSASAPLAQAKGLTLTFVVETEARLTVLGDAHRLRQILTNLVTNAIKFTEQGGVRLTVSRSDDHRQPAQVTLAFRIEDSGIGISASSLRQLFRPFTQADASTARRFGGTGLGLAISGRLAELMGGAITAHSEIGRGSTFSAGLPFTITEFQAQRKPETKRQNPLPRLSILVVEDSRVALDLALELLEVLGCHADGAANGAEALAALEQKPYDVVFMDVQMPVMDGLTLTRMIRRRRWPHGQQPNIVALTANVLFDDRAACREAGMDAFMGKPLHLDDLRNFLASVRTPAKTGSAGQTEVMRPLKLNARVVADLKSHVDAQGRSLFDRYAPRVADEVTALVEQMERNLERRDVAALAGLAHQAKGHAKMMGATAAAAAVADAEAVAKAGNLPRFARLWPRAKLMLQRLVVTLKRTHVAS